MFLDIPISAIGAAKLKAEAEKKEARCFFEVIENLPIETQERMKKEKAERIEKYRHDEIEERRHKELCQAIRSTSFWKLGI